MTHSCLVIAEQALIDHLVATTGLPPSEATRVIEDVVAYFDEPVEAYVRRRHAQLKTYGAKNESIFTLLADELRARVVAAPRLTERQLRRLIYG